MENFLNNNNKIEIIAEIAQGYEGNKTISKRLVQAAYKAKADSIKFQLVYADELCIPGYKYYDFFKKLELEQKDWSEIIKYSKKRKLKFYFDVFGGLGLKLSQKLNVNGIKIHPTDLNNYKLLKLIRTSSIKKIFLGVGGAYLEEILKAVKILSNKKIILLLGFQGYPTLSNENNLERIKFLKEKLHRIKNIKFGFADHDINKKHFKNNASIVAVGCGALFFEKHLTIKYGKKPLEDSESAYFVDDFKKYKQVLINSYDCYKIEKNINSKNFNLNKSEKKYRNLIRKSLVANRNINKGTILTAKMFDLKRVPESKSVKEIQHAVGKKIKKFLKKNKPLKTNFI